MWVCRALDMALPLPAAVRRDLRRLGQRCVLCSGVCFGQCTWVKQPFLLGHTTAGCTLKFSIVRVLMLRLRPLCGGLVICAQQHRGGAASVGWSGGAAPRVPGLGAALPWSHLTASRASPGVYWQRLLGSAASRCETFISSGYFIQRFVFSLYFFKSVHERH